MTVKPHAAIALSGMSSIRATGGSWSQTGTPDPDATAYHEDDEWVCELGGTTWLDAERHTE
eukprot:731682-Prorocentrum_lima.AAC.1